MASVNEELAQELHRPVVKEFKRRKFYVRFKRNIWAADLAEMGSLSSKIEVLHIYYVIGVFNKDAWFKPLKNKEAKTVLHDFIELVNESKRKPNKLWVAQGKYFYNSLI